MKKSVEKTVTALEKYIPSEILVLNEEKVKNIIAKTDTDTLHKKFNELNFLYDIFTKGVKEEIIKRLKSSGDNNIETTIGNIVLMKRNDIKVENEEELIKIMKKNSIPINEIFDEEYELVNKNPKVLKTLLDKNIVAKVYRLNRDKLKIAIEKYKVIKDSVVTKITEYLRGL